MALYYKVNGVLVKVSGVGDIFRPGDKVVIVGYDIPAVVKKVTGSMVQIEIKKAGMGFRHGDITEFHKDELRGR